MTARNCRVADDLRELDLSDAGRPQEFLKEELTGMRRRSMCRKANHGCVVSELLGLSVRLR